MGNRAEIEFPALGPPEASAQRGAEPPFVAADCALDLPALPVSFPGEVRVHHRAIAPGRGFGCRAPPQRGDDAVSAEFLADFSVMAFAVIARVGQQLVERLSGVGAGDSAVKLDVVGQRPAISDGREDQVRFRVDDDRPLGKAAFS